MTLSRYEIFSKVVELRSFSKAAAFLNVTQPGISHAINSLEKEWGIPLITRAKSGIQLTSDGEQIIRNIRELLKIHEDIQQQVAAIKGVEVGTVKVGTFSSVASQWLPKIINTFQEHNPNIKVQLFQGDYKTIETLLLNNQIDCGFLVLPSTSSSLKTFPLLKDPLVCIVSNEHPLSKQERILFSQIEKEPFIKPGEGGDIDVKRIFKEYDIKPNIRYELFEDTTIVSMVENNHGISILPEMALKGFFRNITILDLEKACYRLIGLATTSIISPATEKFITTVKTWVEDLPKNK